MIFFTKNPNLKRNVLGDGIEGGRGLGRGKWTDRTNEQAQTNLPHQLLRSWGAKQGLNVRVMALTSSIYDHFYP